MMKISLKSKVWGYSQADGPEKSDRGHAEIRNKSQESFSYTIQIIILNKIPLDLPN